MKEEKYSEVPLNLKDLVRFSMQQKVDIIAPHFNKDIITDDQISRIINAISVTLNIKPDRTFIGIVLLFLQGAASSSAPLTMSVVADR